MNRFQQYIGIHYDDVLQLVYITDCLLISHTLATAIQSEEYIRFLSVSVKMSVTTQ